VNKDHEREVAVRAPIRATSSGWVRISRTRRRIDLDQRRELAPTEPAWHRPFAGVRGVTVGGLRGRATTDTRRPAFRGEIGDALVRVARGVGIEKSGLTLTGG
jgi:hypothetical protein